MSFELYAFMKNYSLGILGVDDDSCDFRSHLPIFSSALSKSYEQYGLQMEIDTALGTLAYLQTSEAHNNPVVQQILGSDYVIDTHSSQTAPNQYFTFF